MTTPIRFGLFLIWSGVMLPVIAIVALIPGTGLAYYSCAISWVRGLLAALGVKVVGHGLDNVPAGTSCVILSNHRSHLDPPVLSFAVPHLITRWVGKKELRRAPFLGPTLVATGQIFIDRQKPELAVAELQAQQDSQEGMAVVFFGEGGRTHGKRLRPFKKGGAAFAISAGLPVVPMCIAGSGACLPTKTLALRPGTVHVAVGKPIDTTGMGPEDREALTEQARQEVERLLFEHEGPLDEPYEVTRAETEARRAARG